MQGRIAPALSLSQMTPEWHRRAAHLSSAGPHTSATHMTRWPRQLSSMGSQRGAPQVRHSPVSGVAGISRQAHQVQPSCGAAEHAGSNQKVPLGRQG